MATYRLTKHLNWDELHNQRVRIDVSDNYVIATKADGSFIILAQAVHSRSGTPKTKRIKPPDDSLGYPQAVVVVSDSENG